MKRGKLLPIHPAHQPILPGPGRPGKQRPVRRAKGLVRRQRPQGLGRKEIEHHGRGRIAPQKNCLPPLRLILGNQRQHGGKPVPVNAHVFARSCLQNLRRDQPVAQPAGIVELAHGHKILCQAMKRTHLVGPCGLERHGLQPGNCLVDISGHGG